MPKQMLRHRKVAPSGNDCIPAQLLNQAALQLVHFRDWCRMRQMTMLASLSLDSMSRDLQPFISQVACYASEDYEEPHNCMSPGKS